MRRWPIGFLILSGAIGPLGCGPSKSVPGEWTTLGENSAGELNFKFEDGGKMSMARDVTDNQLVLHGRLSGTWRQTGNQVSIVFTDLSVPGADQEHTGRYISELRGRETIGRVTDYSIKFMEDGSMLWTNLTDPKKPASVFRRR